MTTGIRGEYPANAGLHAGVNPPALSTSARIVKRFVKLRVRTIGAGEHETTIDATPLGAGSGCPRGNRDASAWEMAMEQSSALAAAGTAPRRPRLAIARDGRQAGAPS